jgi:hypothetical protein
VRLPDPDVRLILHQDGRATSAHADIQVTALRPLRVDPSTAPHVTLFGGREACQQERCLTTSNTILPAEIYPSADDVEAGSIC